ncbi:MAG: RnfABCDGE type electron transport complex subunit A [Treponema sp.]|nr:RnfABCDGE type electron transport complex subunit A [Candidatus Treponema merdequi]
MSELLKIFIKAVLVDNVILVQYLALCPFMGMTSSTEKSFGMGIATSFVIVLATMVTYPIYYCILVPYNLKFLQTLIFILVIAALVQLVEFYLKKSAPSLYSSMGVYLALITTNCAVLAVSIKSIARNYNYLEAIFYALGTSGGFILSMVIMAGVRERMRSSNVPSFLKGKAILFITASLLSLSFMGFKGLIK